MSAEDRLAALSSSGARCSRTTARRQSSHTRRVHRRALRSGVVCQSNKIGVFATSVVLGQASARAQGKLVPGPLGERAVKTTKRVAVAFWRKGDIGPSFEHPLGIAAGFWWFRTDWG